NRLLNNGTHYPGWLGRLRFRSIPELKRVRGDIVRITTVKRGKPRSSELMNQTWIHEEEHVAQADRHDKKVVLGHLATWGMTAASAVAGYRLGPGVSVLAAGLGNRIGYILSPHEIQARRRAGQHKRRKAQAVTTTAIRRIN